MATRRVVGGEGVVLRDVHVPETKSAGADAQVPRGTAGAARRASLQEVSRSRAWWSVPQLLFRVAMSVGEYRTKRSYLWSLGYRRRLAVRKALWHIR